MTEPTILLSQRFSQDSQAVWQAAVRRGWPVHRAIRFSVPDPLPELVCAYGEVTFCDIMADRARLALLDVPDSWLALLPREFVKRDVWQCTKLTVDAEKFNSRLFFKPANDKVFQCGVYERATDLHLKHIDDDCPILVSEVVEFNVEFRCWVLDGKVINCEYYRLVGERDENAAREEAIDFAETVLAHQPEKLPSAVVLDVGIIEGRGWAVVEANQAYASGIYGDAPVDDLLNVILRAAGPQHLLLERDRPFVRSV